MGKKTSLITYVQNLFNMFLKGKSLKARMAQSAIWVGFGSSIDRVLRLLRNIILTRILAPEDFGIMAIVLSINEFFQAITEMGIRNAIIQNPHGDKQTYLNGAWWLSSCRAVGLYSVVFIFSPYISRFYENTELTMFIRVAFLGVLFNGSMSSKAYVAIKKMNFKHWVLISNGGGVFGIIVSIVMAFIIPNTWALVIGVTSEACARFILSYIICPFMPGIKFEKKHLQPLFRYARGTFGIPLLYFIFMRTDIFVIGKLLPNKELGTYAMAVTLARMPLGFIASLFSEILMPALSEIQAEKERFNRLILQPISIILFLGFPALMFVMFYGKDLLHILYGEQYAYVAIPFAVVFASELLRVSSLPIATAYLAVGHPEIHRLFNVIRAVLMILLIYPFVSAYGLIGASVTGFIAMVVALFFQLHQIRKLTNFNVKDFYIVFFKAFCISLIVAIFWIITDGIVSSGYIKMIIGVSACLLSYIILFLWHTKDKSNKVIQ